jgi:hypothetical protein
MGSSSFAVLKSEHLEDNPVPVPRAARVCKGPHRYDGTIVNNKAIGYVPVTYEHQDFPRMVYHPNWGEKPEPEGAKFFMGAVTQEQMMSAHAAYEQARSEWRRHNRTKLVKSKSEFEALIKKGWLAKPPLREDNPQFDMDSDEL